MANNMRWRWGETNPVMVEVASSTVIEIGDLVYLDSGKAKPAADITFSATTAATQAAFNAVFLGVAMQSSVEGSAGSIRVSTTGTYEYPCASATFALGEKVGPAANSDGDKLENQKLVSVAKSYYAVGRVTRREASSTEKILVDIISTVMHGGVAGSDPTHETAAV